MHLLKSLLAASTLPLTALAFRDTSPFILLSTSSLPLKSNSIALSKTVQDDITSSFSTCPSDIYLFVHQPSLSSSDLRSLGSESWFANLLASDSKHSISTKYNVPDVKGTIEREDLMAQLERDCGAERMSIDARTGSFDTFDDMRPRIVEVAFPKLESGRGRLDELANNDRFMSSILDLIPSKRYTIIYTSTAEHAPREHNDKSSLYHMDAGFGGTEHVLGKRDFAINANSSSNSTIPSNAPLFEKYSYLSPGLFQGLLVTLFLLIIMSVALRAISSLEVSYAAFEKPSGPQTAAKKQ